MNEQKYLELTRPFNIFDMPKEHAQLLTDYQKQTIEGYKPLTPQTADRPLFARKIHTAQQLIDELAHVKGNSPAEVSKNGHKLFGRMSDAFRSNPSEMLKLIDMYPRAFSLADPSIVTKDFAMDVLKVAPRAYDLFPHEFQQDSDIAQLYAKEMMKHARSETITAHKQRTSDFDSISVSAIALNPKCPLDKALSVDLYKDLIKDSLLGKGREVFFHDVYKDSYLYIQRPIVMMQYMKDTMPHMEAEFLKAEKEAFEEVKHQLKAKIEETWGTRLDNVDCVKGFADKHKMVEFGNEFVEKAWHTYCAQRSEHSNIPPTRRFICNHAPAHIAKQYFDLTTGFSLKETENHKKQEMPKEFAFSRDTTPSIKKEDEIVIDKNSRDEISNTPTHGDRR